EALVGLLRLGGASRQAVRLTEEAIGIRKPEGRDRARFAERDGALEHLRRLAALSVVEEEPPEPIGVTPLARLGLEGALVGADGVPGLAELLEGLAEVGEGLVATG